MSAQLEQPVKVEVPSPWLSLARVVTSPVHTFEQLSAKPPIAPGYIAQTFATLLAMSVVIPTMLNLTLRQVVDAGASATMLGIVKTTVVVTSLVGPLFMPWIAGTVVSLLAVLMELFTGGNRRFADYLGMIGYARVPLSLGWLVTAWVSSHAQTLQQLQVGFSLALFLPPTAEPHLRAFLTTLNPFDFWYYALAGIGYAVLRRQKPITGLSFTLAVYLLNVLWFQITTSFPSMH